MAKLLTGFLIIGFLLLLFFSFFQFNMVAGTYMEPGLRDRQQVLVRRYAIFEPNPKRGDVVLYSVSGQSHIGRVIALPSEAVRIQDDSLYIDDNYQKYKVEEKYLPFGIAMSAYPEGEWIRVDKYSYLILRDKRDKSFQIKDQIINKALIEGVVIKSF